MGMGKIIAGAALGVGAVALAPLTGGGSLLGGASLAGSLGLTAAGVASWGVVTSAALAGVSGGLLGKFLSKEPQEERPKKEGLSLEKKITLITAIISLVAAVISAVR